MSVSVEKLQALLARIQQNRSAPRRDVRARTEERAPASPSMSPARPPAHSPLEIAIEVELAKPAPAPQAAPHPPRPVTPPPMPAIRTREEVAPVVPLPAKESVAPAAAPPVRSSTPAPVVPLTPAAASVPPAAAMKAASSEPQRIESIPIEIEAPVARVVGHVPAEQPLTFGGLLRRTLALRPR